MPKTPYAVMIMQDKDLRDALDIKIVEVEQRFIGEDHELDDADVDEQIEEQCNFDNMDDWKYWPTNSKDLAKLCNKLERLTEYIKEYQNVLAKREVDKRQFPLPSL